MEMCFGISVGTLSTGPIMMLNFCFSQRLQHNKSKKKKRQEYRDRHQDNDDDQPAKKKPLLQTPMEERPICRFFKEGKCQKV